MKNMFGIAGALALISSPLAAQDSLSSFTQAGLASSELDEVRGEFFFDWDEFKEALEEGMQDGSVQIVRDPVTGRMTVRGINFRHNTIGTNRIDASTTTLTRSETGQTSFAQGAGYFNTVVIKNDWK